MILHAPQQKTKRQLTHCTHSVHCLHVSECLKLYLKLFLCLLTRDVNQRTADNNLCVGLGLTHFCVMPGAKPQLFSNKESSPSALVSHSMSLLSQFIPYVADLHTMSTGKQEERACL